ncbi:carotenoid oxygenase family protein [Kitasatospora sp. NPDC001683]
MPDTLVVDVVRHPAGVDLRDIGASRPTLDRWTVDLAAGMAKEERLDDRIQEFPRLNSRFTGRPYRYGYAAAVELYAPPTGSDDDRPDEGFSNALLKHAFERGTVEAHEFGRDGAVGAGRSPGCTCRRGSSRWGCAGIGCRGRSPLVLRGKSVGPTSCARGSEGAGCQPISMVKVEVLPSWAVRVTGPKVMKVVEVAPGAR